jgi:hypothetical protein
MVQELNYVACQISSASGLDALQRVLLTYAGGNHIALAGDPGIGKTELIQQMPKIIDVPLLEIGCTNDMTDSPLLGFPTLVKDGQTTVTKWVNGVITEAADTGSLVCADEFEQLRQTVQKALNSINDDRRAVKRRDGLVVKAQDGYGCFISYNPGGSVARHVLEDSVADRFVHFAFKPLPAPLRAALALNDFSRLNLEKRGVTYNRTDKSIQYLRNDGNKWVDFFTGNVQNDTEGIKAYNAYTDHVEYHPSAPKLDSYDVALKIEEVIDVARNLAKNGTSSLEADEITALGVAEFSQLQLHTPSLRISKAAAWQYETLVGMGMEPEKAQAHAAQICVDQICYGRFGERTVDGDGGATVSDVMQRMAQYKGLIGEKDQNAGLVPP